MRFAESEFPQQVDLRTVELDVLSEPSVNAAIHRNGAVQHGVVGCGDAGEAHDPGIVHHNVNAPKLFFSNVEYLGWFGI